MKQIKAIFFDIDGTLVSFDTHRVLDETRDALRQLRAKGIKIFIASGRHIDSIDKLTGIVFDGFVLINGTLVMACGPEGATAEQLAHGEATAEQIIYRHPIAREDVGRWLDYLDHKPHSTILVAEKRLLLNFLDDDMRSVMQMLDFPTPPMGDLRSLQDEHIYQIITTFRNDSDEVILSVLPHCKPQRWHPLFTDIIERDGSKALGIQSLMDYHHLQRDEVMAFGDGGNDVEMLQMVGLGVAMGNARDEVKAHADYVTTSVDDNGIPAALRHFGIL